VPGCVSFSTRTAFLGRGFPRATDTHCTGCVCDRCRRRKRRDHRM